MYACKTLVADVASFGTLLYPSLSLLIAKTVLISAHLGSFLETLFLSSPLRVIDSDWNTRSYQCKWCLSYRAPATIGSINFSKKNFLDYAL